MVVILSLAMYIDKSFYYGFIMKISDKTKILERKGVYEKNIAFIGNSSYSSYFNGYHQ